MPSTVTQPKKMSLAACHQVLTVDDALAVRAVRLRSDEVLEHRGLGLFGLKEQRIGLVATEHQQDPCSGADASHADHLASGVDQRNSSSRWRRSDWRVPR